MPTATFTTITSFEMVLFGKNAIAFFRPIKIPFFDRNDFFHFACDSIIKLVDFVDNTSIYCSKTSILRTYLCYSTDKYNCWQHI